MKQIHANPIKHFNHSVVSCCSQTPFVRRGRVWQRQRGVQRRLRVRAPTMGFPIADGHHVPNGKPLVFMGVPHRFDSLPMFTLAKV